MEHCFNNNAGGVYAKFTTTFTNPATGAAAPALNVQHFMVPATAGNYGEFKCACSKCKADGK